VTRCGVLLPTFDPLRAGGMPQVTEAARLAEEAGFDAIWVGDHLACPAPVLDSVACLAAAAAVTRDIDLGFSVLLLGLRQPAWAAKQIATLQHLSHGRLQLGVGVGGEFAEEFVAAGVPVKGRGARLDAALDVLPDLLTGRSVPALEPALDRVPPLLIGGRGEAALHRAARVGDAWLPMWLTPGALARRARRLRELAAARERPAPRIALLVGLRVDDDAAAAVRQAEAHLQGQYRLALESVARWTPLGDAATVAEHLAAHVEAGVEELVLMPLGAEPLQQIERLADVHARLKQGAPT
jgi:alkanesulfonate monooxygenase SsuD/methylene tetrahydromethanopterin reductase-like flavin-dependent oxidoreductase (luciferase family)